MIKERPILFSAPMVRAILEGRKMQTRRIVKEGEDINLVRVEMHSNEAWFFVAGCEKPFSKVNCPYGKPGDRLWVRETFAYDVAEHPPYDVSGNPTCSEAFTYKADCDFEPVGGWKPSIHMPRAASRITLEVEKVRVERLQEISEEDAKAEGAEMQPAETGQLDANGNPIDKGSYRLGFYSLWESINNPGSWGKNPWVFVRDFKRV